MCGYCKMVNEFVFVLPQVCDMPAQWSKYVIEGDTNTVEWHINNFLQVLKLMADTHP